jgi:hypothetical protein
MGELQKTYMGKRKHETRRGKALALGSLEE